MSSALFKRFTTTRELLRLATGGIAISVVALLDRKIRYKRLASPKTTAYYGIVEAKKYVKFLSASTNEGQSFQLDFYEAGTMGLKSHE